VAGKNDNFLLTCPICRKKMWLRGANRHRAAKHADVTRDDFENLIIDAVVTGKIKARQFGGATAKVISGTQRLRQASRGTVGVRKVVSGGRVS